MGRRGSGGVLLLPEPSIEEFFSGLKSHHLMVRVPLERVRERERGREGGREGGRGGREGGREGGEGGREGGREGREKGREEGGREGRERGRGGRQHQWIATSPLGIT